MGSIIKAICKCGFESEDIFAGGGFSNFQTTCTAPAICLNCLRFLLKNYMKKNQKCPDCGKEVTFYNDPSVQTQINESKKSEDIFSWHISDEREDFQLPNIRYLCPKCGKMTLIFYSHWKLGLTPYRIDTHIIKPFRKDSRKMHLTKIYQKLLKHFSKQYWWPAETRFEVIIGAILTQQTTWKNVESAIENLKDNGLLDPHSLATAPLDHVEALIRQTGFYSQKALNSEACLYTHAISLLV